MEANQAADPATPTAPSACVAGAAPFSCPGSPHFDSPDSEAEQSQPSREERRKCMQHGTYLVKKCGVGSLAYAVWYYAVGLRMGCKTEPVSDGHCELGQQKFVLDFSLYPDVGSTSSRPRSAAAERQAAKRLRDRRSASPASDSADSSQHGPVSQRSQQRDFKKLKDAFEDIDGDARKTAAVQSFLDFGPVRQTLQANSVLSLAGDSLCHASCKRPNMLRSRHVAQQA